MKKDFSFLARRHSSYEERIEAERTKTRKNREDGKSCKSCTLLKPTKTPLLGYCSYKKIYRSPFYICHAHSHKEENNNE